MIARNVLLKELYSSHEREQIEDECEEINQLEYARMRTIFVVEKKTFGMSKEKTTDLKFILQLSIVQLNIFHC